jgi:inosine-uridine nucleoside N-ribohydrolase
MKELNIILDTDIGTNPDDLFGLLLLLHVPHVHLRLVVTGNGYPTERARLVHKVLNNEKRSDVMVCSGNPTGHIDFNGKQFIDGYAPSISSDYITAIKQILDTHENVVYINIQGCSNLSEFMASHPGYRDRLHVYHMGLTTKGSEDFISGGTNMEADLVAARHVYLSGIDLKVVGSHTTINDALRVHPGTFLYKKLQASTHPNHKLLLEHLLDYNKRRNIWPALHDPLTVAIALGNNFVEFEEVEVEFNSEGEYRKGIGTKVIVSKPESKAKEFMSYCEVHI